MAKAKKSAPVKLTPDQLQELKDAIISGEAPASIHNRLGASLANIHYHKGELKKKGLLNSTGKSKPPAPARKSAGAAKKETKLQTPPAPVKEKKHTGSFNLIVSGVSVMIEGAVAVAVGKDYIKIDY